MEMPKVVYIYGDGAIWKFGKARLKRAAEASEPLMEGLQLKSPYQNWETNQWHKLPEALYQYGPDEDGYYDSSLESWGEGVIVAHYDDFRNRLDDLFGPLPSGEYRDGDSYRG